LSMNRTESREVMRSRASSPKRRDGKKVDEYS
jgi:hypothetical protein